MTKKEEVKKEEPKKNNKTLKIIITVIVIIALLVATPFGCKYYKDSKSDLKISIQKLENEVDQKEVEQNDIFMDEGFSEKYYELAREIDDLSTKIVSKKAKLTIVYNILPIIIIGIIAVVIAGIIVGKIIASSFDKLPAPTQNTNKLRVMMGQHKVVLDIVDRRLKESENETKLKPLKCPSCKANISHDATKCEYCGTNLVKVKK